jgi:ATP phosphoribosyltransferase
MDKQGRLKLAIQKSGRLTDLSTDLLVRCGLKFSRGKDQLVGFGENMPLDLLFVRDDDIPDLVEEDVCDLGLVGLNVVEEKRLELASRGHPARFEILRSLDFGRCRLADAICDLVSTGSTLVANRLREVEVVLESHAVLVRTPLELPPLKADWVERLLMRIDGVQQVRESKYIMLHAPRSALPAIRKLLPGSESPTIIPLEGSADKVAVHAVCRENVFWETLEALKAAGASALLVLPVEKMLA